MASPLLNINYFDAWCGPTRREMLSLHIDRFVAAHALRFSLAGAPGIYFHSLFGSRGWPEGVTQPGHNRAITRQKLERGEVERALSDPQSLRARVFQRLKHLLHVRSRLNTFDPSSPQRVIELNRAIFAVERGSILCLHNVSDQPQSTALDQTWRHARDLLSSRSAEINLTLQPYEVVWLQHE